MTDPMAPISGTTAGAIHLTGWQMGRDAERQRITQLLTQQTLYYQEFHYFRPVNIKKLLDPECPPQSPTLVSDADSFEC